MSENKQPSNKMLADVNETLLSKQARSIPSPLADEYQCNSNGHCLFSDNALLSMNVVLTATLLHNHTLTLHRSQNSLTEPRSDKKVLVNTLTRTLEC